MRPYTRNLGQPTFDTVSAVRPGIFSMINGIYHWGPALSYATLIFSLSQQSDPPGADWAPDYVAHVLEYALFALTLVWGVSSGFRKPLTWQHILLTAVLAAVYALSDEFHQSFVSSREASWQDVAADVLGSVSCLGAVYFTRRGKWR